MRTYQSLLLASLFLWACFTQSLFTQSLLAQTTAIYVTDQNGIHRVDLESKVPETIIHVMLREPGGMAVNGSAGKIYWTDFDSQLNEGVVQRANLDGSEVEFLSVAGMHQALGIALDTENGMMYWTESETQAIYRAQLDGSRSEPLISDTRGKPAGIALDIDAGKMYWTELETSTIHRANLDGSESETLLTYALGAPRYLSLDLQSGKMYWADNSAFSIRRANLDGTEMESLISTTSRPTGISLDIEEEKVYWSELPSFGAPRKIRRANLDGTADEDVIATSSAFFPESLAFDSTSGKLYWFDNLGKKIQAAPTDGSSIDDIITAIGFPWGLAIDTNDSKVYWADFRTNKILRANLDGSDVEEVFTGLFPLSGIALDAQADMLYWTLEQQIQRGKLDGTEIETLVSGTGFVFSIALAPQTNQLFWTDEGFANVQSSNIDGSNVMDVLPGHLASDVDFDPGQNALYLVSWDRIQRYDLNTFSLEDIVITENGGGLHISLDIPGESMYWIDYDASESILRNGKIRRADLDGSNPEDLLLIGLRNPNDIALLPGAAIRSSNEREPSLSSSFTLTSGYPNPFRSTITFTVRLSEATGLDVRIYDLLGREVDILAKTTWPAGQHTFSWNSDSSPAGVYLVKATQEDGQQATQTIVKID